MADLAERLAALTPEIDHDRARTRFERARRARRHRRRVTLAGVGAVFATTVGLVTGTLDLGEDGTTAVTSTGDTAAEVRFIDLQGRDTRVVLPPLLARDFQVEGLSAAVQLGPSSWRVDVTRSGESASTGEADCRTPPETVTGRVGEWYITFSGDGMTTASCRGLREEVDAFVLRNGVPTYSGTARLGSIDSPDVTATSATASFSLFHRSPTCDQAARRTETGLRIERIDDAAREMPLTVLCDTAESIELWIQSPDWPEDVDAIEITPGNSGAVDNAAGVATYDLDLPGAELVEDRPHMASNTDVALWSDGRGVYVSLTARPGNYGAPGLGGMVRDDGFPEDAGKAWLSEAEDPRTAAMWWVRPSGDLWLLRAYWYGDAPAEAPEAQLRAWALDIEQDDAANPPYVMGDPGLTLAAFEPAGDRPSRSRVWTLDGQEIVLLVNEGSGAAGPSNLLVRGAPAITEVPELGEVWTVGPTYGWEIPGSRDAWATLDLPAALAARADDILRSLRRRT